MQGTKKPDDKGDEHYYAANVHRHAAACRHYYPSFWVRDDLIRLPHLEQEVKGCRRNAGELPNPRGNNSKRRENTPTSLRGFYGDIMA